MPERPFTIAAYAAGVSLAAITLVYVFAPNFFHDGESSKQSSSTSHSGAVGLSNPANDCFINSVLQCLAGLGELRIYLIRETHRRTLDGSWYKIDAEDGTGDVLAVSKADDLQGGIVTCALKEVLDSLNERPKYRKTMSARTFVSALERAFRQRISRQQQDAQEFLQIVVERLSEEDQARRANQQPEGLQHEDVKTTDEVQEEFPFEGELESQVQCQTCGFRPKPTISKFVTLTLHVPQQSATTLGRCFDGLLKTEYIDDFKCEKCRLVHAVELRTQLLSRTTSAPERAIIEEDIRKIKLAIHADPEQMPKDVLLPDAKDAPRRRIERHVRISRFPQIIAIHLSRSIFDLGSSSTKNSARVAFPEVLPLGGLLDRRRYKLSGVVTHRGGHNSGHYESFRRQIVLEPSPTPSLVQSSSGNQMRSRTPSTGSGELQEKEEFDGRVSNEGGTAVRPQQDASASSGSATSHSSPEYNSDLPSTGSASHRPESTPGTATNCLPHDPQETNDQRASQSTDYISTASTTSTTTTPVPTTIVTTTSSTTTTHTDTSKAKRRSTPAKARKSKAETNHSKSGIGNHHGPNNDKWWRISDENIQDTHTSAILNLQREVYLLFYERE